MGYYIYVCVCIHYNTGLLYIEVTIYRGYYISRLLTDREANETDTIASNARTCIIR